ncbi:MAG: hypothetical protein RLZZ165_2382 [Bacteroidota bacterium]|jgi:peroxiredoxin
MESKGEPFEATFHIAHAPDSFARIIVTIGSTNFLIDSMKPVNGTYHIKMDTALNSGLYFLVVNSQVAYQFLLDQDQTFTLTSDLTDPIRSAKVEGSLDNQLLYENLRWEQAFQARLQPLDSQLRAMQPEDPARADLQKQIDILLAERRAYLNGFQEKHPRSFFTAFKLAGQNPEFRDIRLPDGSPDEQERLFHYRNDFWNNTPLDDPRLLRTPIILNKLNTYMTGITPQVHDSVVKYADLLIGKARVNKDMFKFFVNWIVNEYRKPKQMGMESVFVHVVDKYWTDDQAFWATPEELKEIRRIANEMRPSLLGKTGQNITCSNLKGGKESLYDLNGPATILFIYNYECEHCQEQAPEMRKVYDRYHPKGLDIFALCTGSDEKEIKEFIRKYHTEPFHNVLDPRYESEYYKKYHVDITPEIYVLDRNHKIVSKDLNPDQLTSILDQLTGN